MADKITSTGDFLRYECGIENGKTMIPGRVGVPTAEEMIDYLAPKIDDFVQRHVAAALRNVERAIPAKTSIEQTQSREAAKPALRVIDAVRAAIKAEL